MQVREFGVCEYGRVWRRMREFTEGRGAETEDEIWLLQHSPVFTQGTSCRAVPRRVDGGGGVAVVHTDRGGQITYHAPGQLIAYLLLDLKRRGLGAKALVGEVEGCLMDLLRDYGVRGERRAGAPGVYVGGAKIAALGLRIRRGCCFHGLSLNVDMDLTPFGWIDVCGYEGLAVTQMRDLVAGGVEFGEVQARMGGELRARFG